MEENTEVITDEKEKLEKLYQIDFKAKKISEELKDTNKPIFIELVGTPKSGKTTLKNSLEEIFKRNNVNFLSRRETAEYNPVSKSSMYYDTWMILELCKNLSEDLSTEEGKVIIYDRGILDRLPWMEFALNNGAMSSNDYLAFKNVFNADIFKKYNPILKIFVTSPELSVKRKGKPGVFVNETSINKFNNLLQKNMVDIQKNASYSNIVKTDKYQGKIKEFISDNVYDIFDGIEKELVKRKEEKEK